MSDWFYITACSGPGVLAAYEWSVEVGNQCAVIAGFATIALMYDHWNHNRWSFTLPVAFLMFVFHPSWTVSAMKGDCSCPRIRASLVMTGAFVALVLVHYFWSKHAWEKQST